MQHSGNRRSVIQAAKYRAEGLNNSALALVPTIRRWAEAQSDTTLGFFYTVSEVELHTDASHSCSKIPPKKPNEKPTRGAGGPRRRRGRSHASLRCEQRVQKHAEMCYTGTGEVLYGACSRKEQRWHFHTGTLTCYRRLSLPMVTEQRRPGHELCQVVLKSSPDTFSCFQKGS